MANHTECVEKKLQKRGVRLQAQGGDPFHCPLQGFNVDNKTNTVTAIRSAEYPQQLRGLNEEMGYVAALKKTLELRAVVTEMAGGIFHTPESFRGFFQSVDAGECAPLLCCLCKQLAGDGEVAALWRSKDVNPHSAWPAPSRQRSAIPLSAANFEDKS